MIDFRYHLVSIIAVFFALAVGIVLGAGPLGERVEEDLPARLDDMRNQNGELQDQILALESSQQYQQDFFELVAGELVSGRLSGETVLVIGLPGVGGDRLDDVGGMLARGDATVTGTIQVEDSWNTPEAEAALDALAVELTTRPLATEGDGYTRGADVLADAVLTRTRPEDVPVDPPSGSESAPGDPSEFMIEESVVTGFTEAGYIDVEDELTAKANFAVIVAEPTAQAEPESGEEGDGEAGDSEGEPEAWFERMVELVGVMDGAAQGVVVAGERDTAAGHDILGSLRSGDDAPEDVSTVDSVELTTAQVAVVYAVAEQVAGDSGHYGLTESADTLSPPIPPRPEPAAPSEDEQDAEGDESGDAESDENGGEGDESGNEGDNDGTGSGDGDGDGGGDDVDAEDGEPDDSDAVGAGVATGESGTL